MSKLGKIMKIDLFRKKKEKELNEKKEHLKNTGIEIDGTPNIDSSGKIQFILTNALINFLIVVGTMGCFLNAFDVNCNMPIVIMGVLIIAVYTAFLYYNTIVKVIGYILGYIGFMYGIFNMGFFIRGGFAYVCNHMMGFLETEFGLPIERSYDVYGYTEKSSVTMCMIFIAFATMLVLNMAISESKGFAIVFVFTFPIVQMALYFDLSINIWYFAMYLAGILGIYFLRNSTHYHIESKKRKGYIRRKRKNKVVYDYVSDGKYSLSFITLMLICIVVFVLMARIVYPQKKFSMSTRYNELKNSTREYTRRMALVGFWGMFNPDGSAGGVGKSKMGQSKYIQLDYETDLIVTTAMENNEGTMYLKSFYGTFYNDAYWETISEHSGNIPKLEDYGLDERSDIECLTTELNEEVYGGSFLGSEKKIEIVNLGATSTYSYLPYYTTENLKNIISYVNDDETTGGIARYYMHSLNYSPLYEIYSVDDFRERVEKKKKESYEKAKEENDKKVKNLLETEEKYSEYVHDVYMDVPKENEEVIKEFCEKYELEPDSENIVEKLAYIFMQDYEYTLIPGVTPSNKEFVNYFLEESKKGYCMYFATASTLIFRYLGIPARFTGGYVYWKEDYLGGKKIENDNGSQDPEWEDYFDNVNYPFGVQEYELDDSMAHAWVEIYIDGFGWIPVDTTPPNSGDDEEEPEDNSNIMDFFANNVFTSENINNARKTSARAFFTIITGAVIIFIMYILVGIFVRIKRKNSRSAIKLYDYLSRCILFTGLKRQESMSYAEYGEIIIENNIMEEESIALVNRILEKEKFSGGELENSEIDYISEQVNKTSEKIYAGLKWYKKLVYRYVKWL